MRGASVLAGQPTGMSLKCFLSLFSIKSSVLVDRSTIHLQQYERVTLLANRPAIELVDCTLGIISHDNISHREGVAQQQSCGVGTTPPQGARAMIELLSQSSCHSSRDLLRNRYHGTFKCARPLVTAFAIPQYYRDTL